jgi:hypothetical protein
MNTVSTNSLLINSESFVLYPWSFVSCPLSSSHDCQLSGQMLYGGDVLQKGNGHTDLFGLGTTLSPKM